MGIGRVIDWGPTAAATATSSITLHAPPLSIDAPNYSL